VRHSAHELDIRGLQVHEALPEVERFLDEAFANGVDAVFLIHGAGTGALRRAIRDHLRTLPYARSFRPGAHGEGGDGVTIVSLA
ncbi:MAG: Smr/MutS family protein, partial [Candidatus Sericytochromatia bacterium]|nr:Smr/MutS family protein [Candidatus Tanganyikabacteria bacterium]